MDVSGRLQQSSKLLHGGPRRRGWVRLPYASAKEIPRLQHPFWWAVGASLGKRAGDWTVSSRTHTLSAWVGDRADRADRADRGARPRPM